MSDPGERPIPVIDDESRVPAYTLPEALRLESGAAVEDARQWPARRQEILRLFERHMYGRAPARPTDLRVEVVEEGPAPYAPGATRAQLRLALGAPRPAIDVLLYLPARRPAPAFVGLNFRGNHTIGVDPRVRLAEGWFCPDAHAGILGDTHREEHRGRMASRWPVAAILAAGFGLATAHYGDIEPDFAAGWRDGVRGLYAGRGVDPLAPDAWGAVAAWAWGLSRIADALEADPRIDFRRLAVIGHSRLGKAALWAGAGDPRFSIVISNNSGCCGAALKRRRFGETYAHINRAFPHWFCPAFRQYDGREERCPVDQHLLLASIAPRPLYVASASEDAWADPKGEFLAALHAGVAYRLLGASPLPADVMPPPDRPVAGTIGYHLRPGRHDLTAYDWRHYLDFAGRQWRG